MSNLEIIPLTESLREEWDGVVTASDDAWLFHQYDWVTEVNERVWGYHSESFLLRDGGRIIGICPLFLREQQLGPGVRWRFLSTGGFGIAGPAFIPALNAAQRQEYIAATFAEIDRFARELGVDRLDVRIPPLAPASLAAQPEYVMALSAFGFRDCSTQTYLVHLDGRSVEDLWRQLAQRCRWSIRKAERNGVTVREMDPIQSVDQYYDLHRTTYRRTGAQPHPRAYFEAISRFGWTKRFAAVHYDRVIAAMNVTTYKRGALYLTSASDATALALGANNLLQWHAIQWAKTNGFAWYEVGEAFPNSEHAKQAGLTTYKAS
ncbi:MAG: GNAT family N-acetyltransferase, partial [bacterium]|nr:GNAT family N-acetyltransferase [bacterium]